jgi:hypothetical protein
MYLFIVQQAQAQQLLLLLIPPMILMVYDLFPMGFCLFVELSFLWYFP